MHPSSPVRPPSPNRARELAETLAWLRVCAVFGQLLTVAIVTEFFDITVPLRPLLGGIGALAAFGLFAFWRLHQPWPVGLREVFGHIAVDIVVLGFLLYWSGGATNPFVSLLVMPIALAAAALPRRHVIGVAALAAACYLVLMPLHVPLPPQDLSGGSRFDLHVAGMAISFAVTAVVLAFFISRLAAALHQREGEIQRERERALRDEGIFAIATQAAGTAHELNTPLSTIRTLLAELRRDHAANGPLAADLDLLSSQAERCRQILRELVAVGSRELAGTPRRMPLSDFVAECERDFHLLRPEAALSLSMDDEAATREIEAAPNLHHALVNLLNNAADASRANGRSEVELGVGIADGRAGFLVRDHGRGGGVAPGVVTAFRSSKRDGLGLGLALAHSTAEHLGGDLSAQAMPDGGLLQRLRVPLARVDNRTR